MLGFPLKNRRSGVFAPLVGALVFKTSGGFEQSSQWVRFPYTPVSGFFHRSCCNSWTSASSTHLLAARLPPSSTALWAIFVFVQTVRHRDYFVPVNDPAAPPM